MATIMDQETYPSMRTLTRPTSPSSQFSVVLDRDLVRPESSNVDWSPDGNCFDIQQHVNYVGYGYRNPLGPEIYFSQTPCRVDDVPYRPLQIGRTDDYTGNTASFYQEPMEMDCSDLSWHCSPTVDPRPYSGIASLNISFNAATSEETPPRKRPRTQHVYAPIFQPVWEDHTAQQCVPSFGPPNSNTTVRQQYVPTFGPTSVYDVSAGNAVYGSRLPEYITRGEHQPYAPTYGPRKFETNWNDAARVGDARMRLPHYLLHGNAKGIPQSSLAISHYRKVPGRPRIEQKSVTSEQQEGGYRQHSSHRYQPYTATARHNFSSNAIGDSNSKPDILHITRDNLRSAASSLSANRRKTASIFRWVAAGRASTLAELEAGISYLPGSAVRPRLSSSATSLTEGLASRKTRQRETSDDLTLHASISSTDFYVTRRKRSKPLPYEEYICNALIVKESTLSASLRKRKRSLDGEDDCTIDVDEDNLTDARGLCRAKRRRKAAAL